MDISSSGNTDVVEAPEERAEYIKMKNFNEDQNAPSTSVDEEDLSEQTTEDCQRIVPEVAENSEGGVMRNMGCWFYCKFIYSIIGLLIGLNVFAVFLTLYKNYNAAVWGFTSGVFAAGVVQLHFIYLRGTLQDYYTHSSLTAILKFGLVGAALSLVGLGTYIALAVTQKQNFDVHDSHFYPAAIMSFLTLKWAIGLAWNSRHYRRVVDHHNPALLSGVRVHPDSDSESIS